MTIYISPNPGKTSASEIALRAAQILLTHGFICRWSSVWSALT